MLFRCIRTLEDGDNVTTLNKIYESTYCNSLMVKITNDLGQIWYAHNERFEEVTELRVGDIVTIRKDLDTVINPIIEYTEKMKQYQGEKAMIEEVVHSTDTYYHIDNDDELWAWSIDMFDFNSPIQKKRQVTKEIDIFESFNT